MQNIKNTVIIDIETVSGYAEFEKAPERLQLLWEKKAKNLKNEEGLDAGQLYEDRAAIYAEFGKVIVIGAGVFSGKEKEPSLTVRSFAGHDEKQLLQDFVTFLVEEFNQGSVQLCGHNGKEFDFPYLCRRLLVNGLPIPFVLDTRGKKPWEVNHIDTMDLWKFGDWKSFTSLELLTEIFGIPTSKDNIDGSMVNEVYHKQDGLEKIRHYCEKDVVATAQLYLKMNAKSTIPDDRISIVD